MLSAIITEQRSWPSLWKESGLRDWICLLQSDGSLLRMDTRATTVLIVAPSCSSLNDVGGEERLWDCVCVALSHTLYVCWRRRWCIQWQARYSEDMWSTVCMRAQYWAPSSLCLCVTQSLSLICFLCKNHQRIRQDSPSHLFIFVTYMRTSCWFPQQNRISLVSTCTKYIHHI